MEAKTNIRRMMAGNSIVVPDYQRAYSWEVKERGAQVRVFLEDLLDYIHSGSRTPYYFGHFLFEKKSETEYAVIDGQQRLTTISIFVCAAFNVLHNFRELSIDEIECYEDVVKRNRTYRFTTVGYDSILMRDYVVDMTKQDHYGIKTTSGIRIVNAFDFFKSELTKLPTEQVGRLLSAIITASCTTHIVETEAEAIQMFIFQNNRGKKPSNLEIIKAQFMYNLHLYCDQEDVESMIKEVKDRFENIYMNISHIEDFVDEDDVLSRTMQVYFHSLWRDNAIDEVSKALSQDDRLDFIISFTQALECTFDKLTKLREDSMQNVDIEYALLNGRYYIVLPFFIKAYNEGFPIEDIARMGKSLGDLMLRDAIVGTRADLRSRLNDVFEKSNGVDDIIGRINWMKTNEDWWWHYWNNAEVRSSADTNWHPNYHTLAKIILWRYENFLIGKQSKGYAPILFHSIESPHLEHIAPQTENGEKEASGYGIYDEDFREHYLLHLGNFLLLSAPHNESIGNKPFEKKRQTYNHLYQQRQIIEMTENDHIWDKTKIKMRTDNLLDFIINNC